MAALARALQDVPAGARVLPLEHHPRLRSDEPRGRRTVLGETSFRHLATLAVPWRHAFVPTLFAARGKQPVAVLPPWRDIADPEGGVVAADNALVKPAAYARDIPFAPYLAHWREAFDFALVLDADAPDIDGPFVPPPGMDLIRDEGFARLYRLPRQTAAGRPAPRTDADAGASPPTR